MAAFNLWGGAVDFVPLGSLRAFCRKRAKIDVAGVTAPGSHDQMSREIGLERRARDVEARAPATHKSHRTAQQFKELPG